MPRSRIQTGIDVLDWGQLKIPGELSLSWYTDNLGAVIPDKYHPNRKDITDPFHRILDRASKYHNDTRPPGVEAVTIYERPRFRTTCRQLASLIPAEYFPPEGSNIVRFLEGVTGYTREKAGMNRYTLPRPNRSSYITPTLAAGTPQSAGLATPKTRQAIKEEPARDSAAVAVIAGFSEESAINLDSDEEADTILPSVESPEHTKKTKSKASPKKSKKSKKSKKAPSSTPRNQAAEDENVPEVAGVCSAEKSKKTLWKKRKYTQGAEDANDTQLIEVASPVEKREPSASKKRSKKLKRSEEAAEAADDSHATDFVTPEEAEDPFKSKKCSQKQQNNGQVTESVPCGSTKPSASNKRKRPNEVAQSEDETQLTAAASTQFQTSFTTKKQKRVGEPAGIEPLANSIDNVDATASQKSKKSTSKRKKRDCPSGNNTETEQAASVPSIPQAKATLKSPRLICVSSESENPWYERTPWASRDTSSESSVEKSPVPVKKSTTFTQGAVDEDNSADEAVDETSSSDEDGDEDERPRATVRRNTDKMLTEKLMADNQALVEKHREEMAVLKQAAKERRQRMRERSQAMAEGHHRQIASLSSDLTRLKDRNQSLEDLLCKGAGLSPLDLERTLVRVGEGLNGYRRAFQMVHKCEGSKIRPGETKGCRSNNSQFATPATSVSRTPSSLRNVAVELHTEHGPCAMC
ncbi:hypothetical protein A1O7_05242 [Cladophialophora yegresii CBS 114405]|uniref:Uncharacterized protein n=1 Tax=Cladophialophora yegresii CBS 114405 TaxID=1182544 RepID=W9WRV7_9EURO|nr:uncharacterized protein A1O7_05242 [Cladophialophora yegresii CBS 114405]EXJ61089.1 hypothetical protein A1O7_05242 [Cladophialophora yegresii CBS 114405]